jgi:hypothetical protein
VASQLRYSGLGMNYGVVHSFVTPFPTTLVAKDLDDMWNDGYRNIRLWLPNFQTSPASSLANIITVGDMAKAKGFYVAYGGTSLGTTLSNGNWTAFSAATIAAAAVAQSHGFSEFIIDNEAYARGVTGGLSNFFTKYAALATSCRSVFTGVLTYNESENSITNWVGQTVGLAGTVPVDKFGLNTYGSGTTEAGWRFFLLNAQICFNQFGTSSYISEFNINASSPYSGLSERQIYENSLFRLEKLLGPKGIGFNQAYWFSYTSPSDQFAVKQADGTFRRNRYAFTRMKRLSPQVIT